ncbi:MAG: ASKHA domain-containing protein [Promethearchaeota archaeon]
MDIKNKSILIDFEPISRRVIISQNTSIYKILTEINIPIRTICGGLGKCGKCKILVQKGKDNLNELTNTEKSILNQTEIENGWRLACQTKVNLTDMKESTDLKSPQLRIFLPRYLLLEEFKILTSGTSKGTNLKPAIQKIYVEVKKPSLNHQKADFERIEEEISYKIKKNKNFKRIIPEFNILNKIPSLLRENNHQITMIIYNSTNIIDWEPGNTTDDNYGIAFDIGTTTVVGYLINLNNGKIYAVDSKLNSQTAYGEDLITRLTYIKNDKQNLEKLNTLIIDDLNEIIKNLCSKANIKASHIYELSIVGNSVMHHIFLGLNPVNIGLSPFIPVIQRNLNVKAEKLKLNISKNANVYTAPIVAGFVGADTIGVILASGIFNEKLNTLAIDIGTNGEIILGNRNNLIVGSCAAGSALEGAHIKDGMRAAAGAIDSVKINPDNFNVSYTTIKNKKPIGICGSGLVDLIAEMLKSKIITRSGNFSRSITDHERLIKTEKNFEFIVAKKGETAMNKEISISQSDIREMQMAKAAFYSGYRIIMNHLSKNRNIEQILLAGAFGNYINAHNAKFIGMIPDIPDSRIFQIGNAAGIGAQYCLLNKKLREKAQKLLQEIKYIEIALEKDFQREYAEAMYFPHLNLDLFPSLTEYIDIPRR